MGLFWNPGHPPPPKTKICPSCFDFQCPSPGFWGFISYYPEDTTADHSKKGELSCSVELIILILPWTLRRNQAPSQIINLVGNVSVVVVSLRDRHQGNVESVWSTIVVLLPTHSQLDVQHELSFPSQSSRNHGVEKWLVSSYSCRNLILEMTRHPWRVSFSANQIRASEQFSTFYF